MADNVDILPWVYLSAKAPAKVYSFLQFDAVSVQVPVQAVSSHGAVPFSPIEWAVFAFPILNRPLAFVDADPPLFCTNSSDTTFCAALVSARADTY